MSNEQQDQLLITLKDQNPINNDPNQDTNPLISDPIDLEKTISDEATRDESSILENLSSLVNDELNLLTEHINVVESMDSSQW